MTDTFTNADRVALESRLKSLESQMECEFRVLKWLALINLAVMWFMLLFTRAAY